MPRCAVLFAAFILRCHIRAARARAAMMPLFIFAILMIIYAAVLSAALRHVVIFIERYARQRALRAPPICRACATRHAGDLRSRRAADMMILMPARVNDAARQCAPPASCCFSRRSRRSRHAAMRRQRHKDAMRGASARHARRARAAAPLLSTAITRAIRHDIYYYAKAIAAITPYAASAPRHAMPCRQRAIMMI